MEKDIDAIINNDKIKTEKYISERQALSNKEKNTPLNIRLTAYDIIFETYSNLQTASMNMCINATIDKVDFLIKNGVEVDYHTKIIEEIKLINRQFL